MNRLTQDLLNRYRELIYDRYGIHYLPTKTENLRIKLGKLAERAGDLEAFFARLVGGDSEAEHVLLREITIGHTFFFREEAHLKLLVKDIRERRIRSPVIWCAASSTGEEPWSIAITLLEEGIDDFLILASDINRESLMAMHRGVYNQGKFQSTPKAILLKYFRKVDPMTWKISRNLRQYLRIRQLNLREPIEFERRFDYIFCRNVMIYFDVAARDRVMANLVRNLGMGGLLFVGHTEALLDIPAELRKTAQSVFRKEV